MLKGRISRGPIVRLLVAVSAVAIGSFGLSGAVGAAPVAVRAPLAGAPDIRLTTTASANVLVGTPASYALVATNPGAASSPAYNMSFRAVLPQGVSYVSGTVSPSSAGAPTQYVDPVTGETTLVWVNVADIQPAGSYRLTFKALADPLGYPVGDAVSVLSAAYANSNPRTVPKFDAQGVVIDGSFTGSDFANPVQTDITAIRIDKAVATAEAELLRGVHDQTTIYTLTVTNNDFARTSFVTVTDLLPAGLEFLQCGGIDNSAPGEVEYSGAPRLTVVPVVTGKEALILPCLGRTEIDEQATGPQFVTVEDSMCAVHASRGHLEPASPDLRSEAWIVSNLAHRVLGPDDSVDWIGLSGDYSRVRDAIEQVIPGFTNFNERIVDGFVLPNPPRDTRTFATGSGKAAFTRAAVVAVEVPPGHLMLQTMRSHDQYNTTIYGLDDRYRGIKGERRVVFVHPDDLTEFGIADGAIVDLVSISPDGERRAAGFRTVGYPTPRGCAAAYFPEANALVPLDSVATESGTPTSKSIVVRLEVSPV